MEHDKKAVFMILVAGRKQKETLLGLLRESNINLINSTYGKGAVKDSVLKNIFGLVPEENKVVFCCITTHAKADTVMQKLVDGHEFDKRNTGMAFTVPIEAVSY